MWEVVIKSLGGALTNGISALIRRNTSDMVFLCHVRTQQEGSICRSGREPSQ